MMSSELSNRLHQLIASNQMSEVGQFFANVSDQNTQIETLISLLGPYIERDPKQLEMVSRINAVLPEMPSKYLSLYGAAAFEGARGDVQKADELMLLSLDKLCDIIERGLPISGLAMSVLIHALYMDPDLAQSFKANDQWKSNLRLDVKISPESEWIVSVSCNGLYFDRFGSEYLRSLEALTSRLHIHFQVVEPTSKTQSLFNELQTKSKHHLSIETEERSVRPVYYICRRFQVAYELMKKFNKPVFITDLDIQVLPKVQELLNIPPAEYDVALFEFSDDYPMLTSHCSLVLMQPRPQVIRLLNLFSLYVDQKMKEEAGLWMLDQCAMFVLSRLAMKNKLQGIQNLKWKDLKALTHAKLSDFQIEQTNSDEKHSMRALAFADFGNFEILGISRDVLMHRRSMRRPNSF